MLTTDRLVLRQWKHSDRVPFAAMNADTDVMRYFDRPRERAESDATVDRLEGHINEHGYGFWAAELKETGAFIGFIGIEHTPSNLPCSPAVEIGWRLDKRFWGRGLAPEGARASLLFAFSKLQLDEVVSFTAEANEPSMRVMEKIGMKRDKSADFDHPAIPKGHPIRSHVFYRIKCSEPILF